MCLIVFKLKRLKTFNQKIVILGVKKINRLDEELIVCFIECHVTKDTKS